MIHDLACGDDQRIGFFLLLQRQWQRRVGRIGRARGDQTLSLTLMHAVGYIGSAGRRHSGVPPAFEGASGSESGRFSLGLG